MKLVNDKEQTVNNPKQANNLVADYWDCVLPDSNASLFKKVEMQALKQTVGFIVLDKATRWGLRQP